MTDRVCGHTTDGPGADERTGTALSEHVSRTVRLRTRLCPYSSSHR